MIVFVAARRTETTLTSERSKVKMAASGTSEHGSALGRITTGNHTINIFDDRLSWAEKIKDMFIIISKDGL